MATITQNGITFSNYNNTDVLKVSSPLKYANYEGLDEDNFGIINAVDIAWNGAQVNQFRQLNTTGDLISWIKTEDQKVAQASVSKGELDTIIREGSSGVLIGCLDDTNSTYITIPNNGQNIDKVTITNSTGQTSPIATETFVNQGTYSLYKEVTKCVKAPLTNGTLASSNYGDVLTSDGQGYTFWSALPEELRYITSGSDGLKIGGSEYKLTIPWSGANDKLMYNGQIVATLNSSPLDQITVRENESITIGPLTIPMVGSSSQGRLTLGVTSGSKYIATLDDFNNYIAWPKIGNNINNGTANQVLTSDGQGGVFWKAVQTGGTSGPVYDYYSEVGYDYGSGTATIQVGGAELEVYADDWSDNRITLKAKNVNIIDLDNYSQVNFGRDTTISSNSIELNSPSISLHGQRSSLYLSTGASITTEAGFTFTYNGNEVATKSDVPRQATKNSLGTIKVLKVYPTEYTSQFYNDHIDPKSDGTATVELYENQKYGINLDSSGKAFVRIPVGTAGNSTAQAIPVGSNIPISFELGPCLWRESEIQTVCNNKINQALSNNTIKTYQVDNSTTTIYGGIPYNNNYNKVVIGEQNSPSGDENIGVAVTTVGGDIFTYNGYEVATLKDIVKTSSPASGNTLGGIKVSANHSETALIKSASDMNSPNLGDLIQHSGMARGVELDSTGHAFVVVPYYIADSSTVEINVNNAAKVNVTSGSGGDGSQIMNAAEHVVLSSTTSTDGLPNPSLTNSIVVGTSNDSGVSVHTVENKKFTYNGSEVVTMDKLRALGLITD